VDRIILWKTRVLFRHIRRLLIIVIGLVLLATVYGEIEQLAWVSLNNISIFAQPLIQNKSLKAIAQPSVSEISQSPAIISDTNATTYQYVRFADLINHTTDTQFLGEIVEDENIEDFTFAIYPDTQRMVQYPENYPYFEELNLVFATHVGDIVQHADNLEEWVAADRIMGILDTANIPYSVGPGNHDMAGYYEIPFSYYNTYFGPARFVTNGHYQGSYEEGMNENNFSFFSASGLDFIVINLQYDPLEEHIEWANQLLQNYPDRIGILISHFIIDKYGNYSSMGQAIYDGVKTNPNLLLMICGHLTSAGYRVELRPGLGSVHIIMANYQTKPYGGNGYLRLLRFSPQENIIYMTTYSDILNEYKTEFPHQLNIICWMTNGENCFMYYFPIFNEIE